MHCNDWMTLSQSKYNPRCKISLNTKMGIDIMTVLQGRRIATAGPSMSGPIHLDPIFLAGPINITLAGPVLYAQENKGGNFLTHCILVL